ncbi:putative prenyltransferase [Nostocoides australiense Ben110]|uniref:Putative prenyltransferase n=1 Tax=Nostocoides australiense Ben110 TaxID=1193182 RepID=W6JUC0_9MICO|nr:decaprenyl-phosphate phosphoribosyltransferase [Tetrasphaera australiensis]CCH72085.1 putative prenyltransferase [Tetrasphaera australiensis Ben110]
MTVGDLLRTARPRQWTKNVLVLAAPVLSAQVVHGDVLLATVGALVAFVLASCGVYYVNDAHDAALDAAHPTKRHRPVAAGRIPVRTAFAIGAVLLALGILCGLLVRPALGLTMAVYVVVNLAYAFVLRDEPILDIAAIGSGFILRTISGGVAAGIWLSEWFLLAASFGSLFVAAGKRYAERLDETIAPGSTRRSLTRYTATYLRFVWTLSAGSLVMTYGLWAFDQQATLTSSLPVLSIAPFVLAVLRYAMHVDAGAGDEPDEIVLHDRWLQGLGLIWVAMVAWPLFS